MTRPIVGIDPAARRDWRELRERDAVAAVVLCGGLARRMGGVDKGLVPLGDRTMVEHVTARVEPQVARVVLNANRSLPRYRGLCDQVVSDRHGDYRGPLAGLAVGLEALSSYDFVFMCPCDSPFVATDLVERLGAALLATGSDVAIPHDGEREQPVFCLVRRRVGDSLRAFLLADGRKIDRWYASLATCAVDCSDIAASFRNVNTEDERQAAEAALPS